MKDKEKQIEKMAKDLHSTHAISSHCSGRDCNHCKYDSLKNFDEYTCIDLSLANDLYNTGYRKLDKDSVVLSSEQYSNYLITQTNNAWLKEQAEKLQADNERLYKNLGKFKQSVSKETAEKILNELYCTPKEQVESKIKELARFIGVEIKE